MNSVVILLSTFPNLDSARNAVRELVNDRLVACGNIIPGVESIYRWQDAIETSAEVIVIFKTTAEVVESAQTRLRELHPYEVPEILHLPADGGLPAYLGWVREQTGLLRD